uniref:J domain-containing protein n=1 Tax=Trichuris muris TaxID=70415 RepID=A0A5S6QUP6_TRIMR
MVKLFISRGLRSSHSRANSFYEVLGVKHDASKEEIKAAFYRLSKQYHPDIVKENSLSHLKYVQIVEAYHVLSRAESRRKYDDKMAQRGVDGAFSQSAAGTWRPTTTDFHYTFHPGWNGTTGFPHNPFIYEYTTPMTEDELRRRRWTIGLFFIISLVATLVQAYHHTMYRVRALKATEENWKALSAAEKYRQKLTMDENMQRIFVQDDGSRADDF